MGFNSAFKGLNCEVLLYERKDTMAATDKFQGTVHVGVFVVIFLHLCKQVRKTTINLGEYEVLSTFAPKFAILISLCSL